MKTKTILDCVEAFAVPGEPYLIDCIHPDTGKSWYNGETLEQIRERYPNAEKVNIQEWTEAKGREQDSPIEWTETTEENYHEMLNVLPPAAYEGGKFLVGEPTDHHAVSGAPRYSAFIHRGGKYFASSRPITKKEFASI